MTVRRGVMATRLYAIERRFAVLEERLSAMLDPGHLRGPEAEATSTGL
jgi:hypothetical protein